jgi:hypothetical protein
MATSGSTDFNLTRDQIINAALKKLGVIEGGESPSNADKADAIIALESMIKFWMAAGFKLWKIEEATVFLEPGQAKYSLSTTGDHAAITTVKTELSAVGASGATSISVDSITDMSSADNIGVILDDGSTHWTTINGAPTGTTVVLTTGLASAASVDAHVYTYTTRLTRPLRLRSSRLRNSADSDTPLLDWSRDEYFDTPNKTSQGTPTALYYDPQLTTGELHVWSTPDTATDRLLIDFDMPLEDFDASTNNADFPQEWANVIIWGLANEMRFDFGVPLEVADRIHAQAKDKVDLALGFDTESESTYFAVSLDPE